ncbi:carbohydrate ABC transporter permease [Paenibacillus sp. F411]|uniref:Binding-protein-dependent transport systems inner membrane component n=1 Tax=Paenibacillus algicola TaxID=2565926 RepID=A0A4V1G473_9BACL|nr:MULTISPECIES: carbohydrate ABC transporter permease [Paenibacillus]MBO2943694.1 carbohydrate ABC transporter permease [Paenibacillus sp. F411]QCT03694.1 binding-protein-dependent transport systems inner membrane component [Paenibacillus algicola]
MPQYPTAGHDPAPQARSKRDYNAISPFWNVIFNIIIGVFAFSCIFPFLFVIMISLTDEQTLAMEGFSLWPSQFSTAAYSYIFQTGGELLSSFSLTLLITVLGTLINLTLVTTYAYALSRRSFEFRGFFSFVAFFTMLFSGGMVPGYIVMTQFLHLQNTIWSLILPLSLSAFSIIVMRTFFQTTVPDEIIESARIDGAGEFTTFVRIVLPVSLPGIATIGLFSSLGYWNDWFNALLYYNDPQKTPPLQYLLMQIEKNMDFLTQNAQNLGSFDAAAGIPTETVRMAMVVLATLPIIMAYPFFQRYFVQGLTVGSVKG